MNFYFHQTDEPRPSPPEILLEIKLIGKFRNREKSDSRRNRTKSLILWFFKIYIQDFTGTCDLYQCLPYVSRNEEPA